MQKQPAEKSYVFDKGYKDIRRAFTVTWGQTFDAQSMKDMFSNPVLVIPNALVFAIVSAFRIALNTVISVLLALLFLSVAPFVYLGFTFVAIFDFIYRFIKRISSICPSCQYRFDLPAYSCPSCGRVHSRLIPSRYGILKRKCICGNKIPTTFFNGRQKLEAQCPKCRFNFRDGGLHVEFSIPVIGGPSSGKTCFINTAIDQIAKKPQIQRDYSFEIAKNGLNDHEEIMRDMRRGALPEKTGDMRLKYYQFYLTPKSEKIKRLISVCDVGGEVFADSDMVGSQVGLRYSDAFIMVIDPLSITAFRKETEKKINIYGYGAGSIDIDEILTRFITTLENLYSVSAKAMLNTDVAVVFTKCDIPGLDSLIGKTAVSNYLKRNAVTKEAAANVLCEKFLIDYEQANFVNGLKSKFKTVQYFTCTSLGGKSPAAIAPEGVEEPVMWLIEKHLKNKIKK